MWKIVTGDEKWVYYDNPSNKKQWLSRSQSASPSLDNARPHVAMRTKETILELGWEVLPHSAYSLDKAPSDYHLFRSMEHFLRDKSFKENQD